MMRVIASRILPFVLALCSFGGVYNLSAQERSRFTGELIVKVLRDGKRMELTEPFGYVDSKGIAWPVPKGIKIDGASIPRALWSIVGSPFTGLYREASVIHDYYCDIKNRHWKAVHRVFYDAMVARGVGEYYAKLMYAAVYRFGPRWDYDADACFCRGCPACATPKITKVRRLNPKYSESDLEALKKLVGDPTNSLEQIEATADYQVNSTLFK